MVFASNAASYENGSSLVFCLTSGYRKGCCDPVGPKEMTLSGEEIGVSFIIEARELPDEVVCSKQLIMR